MSRLLCGAALLFPTASDGTSRITPLEDPAVEVLGLGLDLVPNDPAVALYKEGPVPRTPGWEPGIQFLSDAHRPGEYVQGLQIATGAVLPVTEVLPMGRRRPTPL